MDINLISILINLTILTNINMMPLICLSMTVVIMLSMVHPIRGCADFTWIEPDEYKNK